MYCLLQNHTYLGEIIHAGKAYLGLHEPIVPKDLWDKVQKLIQANKQTSKQRTKAASASLLAGMVYLDDGTRLTPTHTNKHGKRYRYYCPGYQRGGDQGKAKPKISLPAHDLETLIEREWKALLTSQPIKDRLAKDEEHGMEATRQLRLLANTWDDLPLPEKIQRLQEANVEVKIGSNEIVLSAHPEDIIERRIHPLTMPRRHKKSNPIENTIQASVYVAHGEKMIVEPHERIEKKDQEQQRQQLLRRIALGRAWSNELIEGNVESTKALALREKKSESYIYDVMRAGCLSPDVVNKVIVSQGPVVNLDDLMVPTAISWDEHSSLLTQTRQ